MAFTVAPVEEELYMYQPEGFVVPGKEDCVCRLRKSLYGLKQSAVKLEKIFKITREISGIFKRANL